MRELYPDVLAEGGLGKALRARLAWLELSAPVLGHDELFHGSKFWALARDATRSATISCEAEERLVVISLTENGIELAVGASPALDVVARCLHAWMTTRGTSTRVLADFEFLQASGDQEAYEAGPDAFVTHAWTRARVRGRKGAAALAALVERAFREPRLRRLMPVLEDGQLGFSSWTSAAVVEGAPRLEVAGERFRVHARGESSAALELDQAVALAADRLPEGMTEVRHGYGD